MFVFAAGVILVCAERFAHSLVQTGADLGISEFVLVQWLAPLASEAPELLIAGLFAWRLNTNAALGTLVSSKVNQWTLLVGTLPIVFSIAAGGLHGLPIDAATARGAVPHRGAVVLRGRDLVQPLDVGPRGVVPVRPVLGAVHRGRVGARGVARRRADRRRDGVPGARHVGARRRPAHDSPGCCATDSRRRTPSWPDPGRRPTPGSIGRVDPRAFLATLTEDDLVAPSLVHVRELPGESIP